MLDAIEWKTGVLSPIGGCSVQQAMDYVLARVGAMTDALTEVAISNQWCALWPADEARARQTPYSMKHERCRATTARRAVSLAQQLSRAVWLECDTAGEFDSAASQAAALAAAGLDCSHS